jgi:ribose transport system substrate-binding protein
MSHQTRCRRPAIRAAFATGATLIALVAAGCSSSGKPAAGGGSSTTPATSTPPTTTNSLSIAAMQVDLTKFTNEVASYPAIAPLSGASALKGKTVWYVPVGSAVPILNTFGVSMQTALAKLGINFHTCDGKFLPTTAASCLNQAAAQGAAGVVAGYIDYKLVPTAYENLISHHIPVLIAGEPNDTGKADTSALAFGDTTESFNLIQKLDAESVIVDSAGKAKVLYVGVTDSPLTIEGAAYSKKFYEDNCPGCTFAEIDYNTASLNKVPSQVSAALISHPDTAYVVTEYDAAAAAGYSGIQIAGFTNKVKLSGTNGSLDSLQRIKAGQVQTVDVGTSPVYFGWQLADAIVRMMTGSLPMTGINGLNGDGIDRVFTKDNVSNLTLTPAAYATNAWYGSDVFEQTFMSAWGV